MAVIQSDLVVVGGGLAGMVTALETARAGLSVTLVDRHPPQHFGGLARWAFGGMALVGTPLQARRKIPDSPERALADWLRFGELAPDDRHALAWAKHYVEHSRPRVYDWLLNEGLKFMPAVNWVERGRHGDGNSLPRYHLLWGTARHMVERLTAALQGPELAGRIRILHSHRATGIEQTDGRISGVVAVDERDQTETRLDAGVVVVASGGINGSLAQVRKHWPTDRPQPAELLNGAHPHADGAMHQLVGKQFDGRIVRAGEMWNYAAGVPHPRPLFDGHGLSLIPCKSALWLNHRGERIGPEPLVTGFDTHWLCRRVAGQEKPWTWQLLNRRIARRELAISGAEHNPRIKNRQFLRFVAGLVLGSSRLLNDMLDQSPHFICAPGLEALAAKMNRLTGGDHVQPAALRATVEAYDANFASGSRLENDPQIHLIRHARQWGPDRLRTCRPAPLQNRRDGPFIAIHTRLITRKSLGGLRTDLGSRVLDRHGIPVAGLYCVGEAAGFGGGGACGKRSLEGTFLPGCILTARAAAQAIVQGG